MKLIERLDSSRLLVVPPLVGIVFRRGRRLDDACALTEGRCLTVVSTKDLEPGGAKKLLAGRIFQNRRFVLVVRDLCEPTGCRTKKQQSAGVPPSRASGAPRGSGKWIGAVRSRAASWLAATSATTAPVDGGSPGRPERSGGPAERVDASAAGWFGSEGEIHHGRSQPREIEYHYGYEQPGAFLSRSSGNALSCTCGNNGYR